MRDLILTTLFALVLSFCTLAETSVWKVEANGSTLYLGGTFHALRAADYPLPAQFGEAFANSDVLVFETNIAELISPSFQQRMLQRGVYRDGSTLQTVLSAPTYQQLNEYCQDAGIPVSSIIRLRPPMAVLTLLGLELHKLGVTQSGVDLHFYQEAGKAGKPTEWLEGVDEQIDFIMSMGEGHEDDFVRHSLRDLKQTREVLAELIDAWRRGDEADLERWTVETMRKDYPVLYQTLLVERNNRWLPKIEAHLQTVPVEFVLVGVGHLVGENGILAELQERGFQITKIE